MRIKVSFLFTLLFVAHSTLIPAIDRVHRIGQDKAVYVKHFIVCDKHFWLLVDANVLFRFLKPSRIEFCRFRSEKPPS